MLISLSCDVNIKKFYLNDDSLPSSLLYYRKSVVGYLNIKMFLNICHLTFHVFQPKNYIDLPWNYVELKPK